MFDIGFSELVVVGVVALIVIGPERLPKVARTAGHLLGRFQRYAAGIKSDISREMQMDELRKVGQDFKESVESAASDVKTQANAVDDYLKDEIVQIENAWTPEPTPQVKTALDESQLPQLEIDPVDLVETQAHPQQSLDLDPPPRVSTHKLPPDTEKNLPT